jgi:hypothetical protein
MDSKTYGWFKIIVPPLLLLPLVAIPPDLPTGIVWFVGSIALIISVFKVLFLLIRELRVLALTKKWNLALRMMLRSVLTIFVMIIAIISLNVSNYRARKQALEIAQQVQATCVERKRCPNKIPTMPTSVGAFIRYPISYAVNQDCSEFSIAVRLNIDSRYVISGGVNKELK